MIENKKTKCGFIAILGAPNAGKSTLVNSIVGGKVSIVSSKVQTTRQRILGIAIRNQTQLILLDTPGIFSPKRRLERAMVKAAWDAGQEADALVLMVDVCDSLTKAFSILESAKDRSITLVLNKVDLIEKEKLFNLIEKFQNFSNISRVFMISALTGDGVEDLVDHLCTLLPEGPWLYPDDHLTDLPQRIWAAEITREQLYHHLHQELPYETMVETENWEEFDNGSVKINQVIYVARDGQKGILLGKKGQKIKDISSSARQELMLHLDRPVHLFLHIKVIEDWMNKRSPYKQMGLEFDS
jgi:GTP-binding protein Era